MARILIKGGRVIDPANKIDACLDILVENGKVVAVEKGITPGKDTRLILAQEKVVTPGLIDIHVHLREPGREDEETVKSASLAAAFGGFTSLACMPNTDPPIDNASVLKLVLEKARQEGVVNVFPIAAVTKKLEGREFSEMAELVCDGAVAFSDDGKSIANAEVMRRALEYIKMLNVPLISHAQDGHLSAQGQMNEGFYSSLLGLKGIPKAAEEVIVARDLILAEEVGGRVHLAHLSTRGSVELVKRAKNKGVKVTSEVTPHHLVLTEEALVNFDTNLKVNPPLRSKDDVEALKEGLQEGVVDVIASDHAPHASYEKEKEFDYAPFGIVGLETTLPLVFTKIVEEGVLKLSEAVAKLALNPARILNLARGTLSVGSVADITIFDPQAQVEVDVNAFKSRSKNSPFHGWKLKGKVSHLLVGGKLIVNER